MIAALLLQRMTTKRRLAAEKRAQIREKCIVNSSDTACCRTCLSTDNLGSIFSKSEEDKMSHNLKLVTGLEIRRDDGLSQKICNKCLGILNLALQFRRKSKKAERTLLDMLTNESVKKYTISEDVKPKIKKAKVEEEEYAYDVPFADDFQNDDDFDSKEDVKPIYVVSKENPRPLKGTRRKHMKVPPGPPYKCNTCGKEFLMKATFSAHLRFHTNYCVCESCGKRCRNNNQLQEHKRARHGLGRIHKCAYCEYSSATKEALVEHKRARHGLGRIHKCAYCEYSSATKEALVLRQEYNNQLQEHKRARHGLGRIHKCAYCEYSSATKEALVLRQEYNNQLQEHKRARHGLGRIHKCAYCEYSSATKEALVIHERRHTGERPYVCDHCGAAFHRRANLVQHIAIHLPDKNFQCTFCPTREKSKKRLQIHISKAHREKRYSYKCPRCLKLFQRNEHAHRHLARVHHIPRAEHPHIERVLIHNDAHKHATIAPHCQYGPADLYPASHLPPM